MNFIVNKCDHPHCLEPMCSDTDWVCPHFKPRLFGFIPVSKKFGEWLFFKEEQRFFKKCCKEHPDAEFVFSDDFGEEDSQ